MQTLAPSFSASRDDAKREMHWTAAGLLDGQSLNELFSLLLAESKPFRDDKKGFRTLGDLRQFAVQPREIAELIEESQKATAHYGCDRMAIVYTSVLVKQQFRRVSEALETRFFESKAEAISWLRG